MGFVRRSWLLLIVAMAAALPALRATVPEQLGISEGQVHQLLLQRRQLRQQAAGKEHSSTAHLEQLLVQQALSSEQAGPARKVLQASAAAKQGNTDSSKSDSSSGSSSNPSSSSGSSNSSGSSSGSSSSTGSDGSGSGSKAPAPADGKPQQQQKEQQQQQQQQVQAPSRTRQPAGSSSGLTFPQTGSKEQPKDTKTNNDLSGLALPPAITNLGGGSDLSGILTSSSIDTSSSSSSSKAGGKPPQAGGSQAKTSQAEPSWPQSIKQLGNPSCVWLQEESTCVPTQDNWLIPSGQPSSPFRRANLMAIARQRHCSSITKESTCWGEQTQRCYWHTTKTGQGDCRSADLLEITFFSNTAYAGTIYDIPLSMTCPGSKAHEFFRCFAHPAASDNCEKLGPCFPVKQQEQSSRQQQWQQQGRSPDGSSSSGSKGSDTLCLPKFFAEMASKDVDDFLAQLWAMDGKAYGNCAGTCWMKQARMCRSTKASNRGECEGVLPFCSWDRSKSRCQKRSLEFESEVDFKVKRLYGLCLDIDNAGDCKVAEQTRPKPSVDWATWKEQGEPVQCT